MTARTCQPHRLDLLLDLFSHLPLVISARLNGSLAARSTAACFVEIEVFTTEIGGIGWHHCGTCTWKNGRRAPMAKLATFKGMYLGPSTDGRDAMLMLQTKTNTEWYAKRLEMLTILSELLS